MGKRIAVIGASGFVGAFLVEDLIAEKRNEVVPVIRSSGNAWRLIRAALQVRVANLLDRNSVVAALEGCTHVVNCSRGGNDVMLTGLQNLLSTASAMKVEGFVHLSSVMVYGDPPNPNSVDESGTLPPQGLDTYGGVKLRQDKMVQKAAADGLPSIILCPPNIGGPYSYFLDGIYNSLRDGSLALLDGGNAVCNVADVANVAHAIKLGLDHCSRESPRLFVTDDEDLTWGRIVAELAPLCDDAPAVPSIERALLMRLRDELFAEPRVNLIGSLKHLFSSDVRAALRKDPLWAKIDGVVRQGIARLGGNFEDRMRLAIEGPVNIPKVAAGRRINIALTAQQLRGVRHSCNRAKTLIGYQPRYSFAESMSAYRAWRQSLTGRNSADWVLARHLWN